MGIQRKEEETRGDIAAPSRSSVLQDPAASRNGCAVLHWRSGRSGAPSPRSLLLSALRDGAAMGAAS
ncbi:hypothetical protein [Rhizobium rhizogenes]|uniref:Uncharacterized protein n=1 Tax=Pararhizobium polonicum TaxID=1612624 RepID=A0A1C7P7X1_9HYPH|nr:hypothetical protein [Rhizobium rhizogenes]NTH16541.1 hypothetical protein [Rhizobium rhizogenes]OBZ97363.1 hypothetical protein ADU59_01060 [Pararhizobium polonicum]TRB17815.1 hypothetical protein EXN70_31090 [Rhizobium rhizogenes]